MAQHRLTTAWVLMGLLVLLNSPPAAAEAKSDPSFLHGVGQLIAGLVIELPKTVLEATFTGPPVVGTAVGLLAGTARAVQTSFAGLHEMAVSFDPWQARQVERAQRGMRVKR